MNPSRRGFFQFAGGAVAAAAVTPLLKENQAPVPQERIGEGITVIDDPHPDAGSHHPQVGEMHIDCGQGDRGAVWIFDGTKWVEVAP